MDELAFLVNPRGGKRRAKRRGHRRARRNPELMLINAGRRSHKRRSRKYHRNPVEDMAFTNPKKLAAKKIAAIRYMRRKKHAKIKTIKRKLHVSAAAISKYAGKHRRRLISVWKRTTKRKGTRKYTKAKATHRKKHYVKHRKHTVAPKKRAHRKARRFGTKRSHTVYVPIHIRRGRGRYKKYFKINDPSGFKDIKPMLVNALWMGAGFLGARVVGNLIGKLPLPAFLKNDLIVHAVVPVVLTAMPIKLPNKGNLLAGAYLSWVIKALNTFLPTNIKGYLAGGLGEGGYTFPTPWQQPWFTYDRPVYPDWVNNPMIGPGQDIDEEYQGLSAYSRSLEGFGVYDRVAGLGVYGPSGPGTPEYPDATHQFGGFGYKQPPQFGNVDEGGLDGDY